MKDYEVKEPGFYDSIKTYETTDRGHADVLNAPVKQIYENTLYNKKKKVDKEQGRGLSSNDYTDKEKEKLAGIGEGAEANVQADWNEKDEKSDAYIKHKPAIPEKAVDVGAVPENFSNTLISTAGWYRFAEMKCQHDLELKGVYDNSCLISIKRSNAHVGNETHMIQFFCLYGKAKFSQLGSFSNTNVITKLRETIDSENKTAYLELYYNANSQNDISCEIGYTKNTINMRWKAIPLRKTEETMDGIRINASSNLIANIDMDMINQKTKRYPSTIDLSNPSIYSEDIYYPVTSSRMPYSGLTHIEVDVSLNSGTKPSWSNHADGFSCHLDVLAHPEGYGTAYADTVVLSHTSRWCDKNPCGFSQMGNSNYAVLWLRGGGKYFVFSNFEFTWTPRTEPFSSNSQTVAPRESYIFDFRKADIYANLKGNADSALKLAANAGSATQPVYFRDGVPVVCDGSVVKIFQVAASNNVISPSISPTFQLLDSEGAYLDMVDIVTNAGTFRIYLFIGNGLDEEVIGNFNGASVDSVPLMIASFRIRSSNNEIQLFKPKSYAFRLTGGLEVNTNVTITIKNIIGYNFGR